MATRAGPDARGPAAGGARARPVAARDAAVPATRRRRSSATSCGPFTRAALPTVRELRPALRDLAAATPDLTRSFQVVNALFNTLAYNPPGDTDEGYLFWLSWANHVGVHGVRHAGRARADPPRHRGLSLPDRAAARDGGGHQPAARHARRSPQRAVHGRDLPRPGGADAVNKAAPSFGRIAAMVVFALSCFGLLLFLWLAFGGPIPLKPQGYRFTGRRSPRRPSSPPRPTCGSPACRSAA